MDLLWLQEVLNVTNCYAKTKIPSYKHQLNGYKLYHYLRIEITALHSAGWNGFMVVRTSAIKNCFLKTFFLWKPKTASTAWDKANRSRKCQTKWTKWTKKRIFNHKMITKTWQLVACCPTLCIWRNETWIILGHRLLITETLCLMILRKDWLHTQGIRKKWRQNCSQIRQIGTLT